MQRRAAKVGKERDSDDETEIKDDHPENMQVR